MTTKAAKREQDEIALAVVGDAIAEVRDLIANHEFELADLYKERAAIAARLAAGERSQ